jgi:hypothetical protein
MRRSAISSAPAAAALLAMTAGLGGCLTTATYGTGESPELAIFRELSGGFGPQKEPIEIQPRAPLVLPPNASQLPPPVATASSANPAWPQQPSADAAVIYSENPRDEINPAEARRLRPLAGLLRPAGPPQINPNHPQPAYDIIHGKQQREAFSAAIDDAEGMSQTGERRFLTEPPIEVRQPAPTAQSEFAEIKKKRGGFLARIFGGG